MPTTQTPLSSAQALPRTWALDLVAYLQAAAAGDERSEAHAKREALASAVQRAPNSAKAWWAFLSQEEGAGRALTGDCTSCPSISGLR